MLVVSTASAYKFAGDVLLSITGDNPEMDLDAPMMLSEYTKTDIPAPLLDAISKAPIHTSIYDKDKGSMAEAVYSFAKN